VLSDDDRALLERIYPLALAEAGELDSPRNRTIAANDLWLFASAGGGTEEEATNALVRGLRSCDARQPGR